ncbi:hypothetical protein ACFPRL_11850 [Pseudoclavibacter helvolus]
MRPSRAMILSGRGNARATWRGGVEKVSLLHTARPTTLRRRGRR